MACAGARTAHLGGAGEKQLMVGDAREIGFGDHRRMCGLQHSLVVGFGWLSLGWGYIANNICDKHAHGGSRRIRAPPLYCNATVPTTPTTVGFSVIERSDGVVGRIDHCRLVCYGNTPDRSLINWSGWVVVCWSSFSLWVR